MPRIVMLLPILFASLISAAEDKNYSPTISSIKVNGEVLPSEDIKRIYDYWVRVYKAPGKPLTNGLLDKLAEISRTQAIKDVAVKQYLEKNKLTLDDATVKEDFEAYKKEVEERNKLKEGAAKDFESELKKSGKSHEQFDKEFALRAGMIRALGADIQKNSLDKVKQDFEKAKEKLPMRRASQIRFSYTGSKFVTSPDRSKENALKEATFALERAKKGEDFPTLVKDLSDETVSKAKNGDLGWLTPTDPPKALVDALYKLQKVGDIAELVETEMGYHVVTMTDLHTEEAEFAKFLKQHIYIQTLAAENKLGKDAKIEEVK